MELKLYLRILLKKWWVVLPAFLVTFTTTIVLTFTQAPTYEATATYIVTPNTSFEDVKSFVSGLETLSRRTEIAATYAEVARSRLIKQEAASELDLSSDQKKSLSVSSKLRAGTNVLEIMIEGNDPVLVRDFANVVGAKTMVYARELYETYEIKPLDPAPLPGSPTKPNKTLNLALGAVVGLVLGVGLAFLSEYLQTPLESAANLGIFDGETGAYNKYYFTQRLGEEMSRARRNEYSLSLALMNVDQLEIMRTSFSPQARNEALRKVTVFLRQYLREEDVVARFEETTFAFLLPDMSEEEAKITMEKLQTRMAWTPFEMEKSGVKLNLTVATGVAAYQYNGMEQSGFMAQANRALQRAEAAGYGKVSSLSELLSEDKDHLGGS